jgi:hypothetical protein
VTRRSRSGLGEAEARRRIGPWPRDGTVFDYKRAINQAEREVRWCGDLEYRFNQRFRFWENPAAFAAAEERIARLLARRREAIRIAEDRRALFQGMVRGSRSE